MSNEDLNQLMYRNYKSYNEKLKKAKNSGFYLEAMFIEYAIIQNRIQSILRRVIKLDNKKGITWLIKKLEVIVNKSNPSEIELIVREKVDTSVFAKILEWTDKRNKYVHALFVQEKTEDELLDYIEEGGTLIKNVSNSAKRFKSKFDKLYPNWRESDC